MRSKRKTLALLLVVLLAVIRKGMVYSDMVIRLKEQPVAQE